MPLSFSQDQLAIINLLLRIAVMAGITSLLLQFRSVVEYLARVKVSRGIEVKLVIFFAVIFSMGIVVRKVSSQAAMDLALEGAIFAGLIGGMRVGSATGFVIGLTCYFLGEPVALPLYTLSGFFAGILYSRLGQMGEIWNYSLNPFLIIYNFMEKLFRRRLDRNFLPFILIIVLALLRYRLLDTYYGRGMLYGYPVRDWFFITIDLTVIVYTLGISLKMANNARMEVIIREEENQLVHAKLSTLKSQINPHFLFNTLNSISALIRTDAGKAREMTRKLASIFRKSLEDTSDTHSLSEEIMFIDDYLSIEKIRFGEEKLKIIKDLEPESMNCHLPSMLLQPVVENAIKHGISCVTCGGRLQISSRCVESGIVVEITNDGPEVDRFDLSVLMDQGVGMKNVVERLKIYSRGEGSLSITPTPGGGAVVRLYIPDTARRRQEG
ncbi:MAG: histidine kinase [Candidatus Krumholzibacteriota bacterium]|nr:histidine kinase [Candidatus Krumholzibacteriota bacterium]